jgi:hypothetical protein
LVSNLRNNIRTKVGGRRPRDREEEREKEEGGGRSGRKKGGERGRGRLRDDTFINHHKQLHRAAKHSPPHESPFRGEHLVVSSLVHQLRIFLSIRFQAGFEVFQKIVHFPANRKEAREIPDLHARSQSRGEGGGGGGGRVEDWKMSIFRRTGKKLGRFRISMKREGRRGRDGIGGRRGE